MVEDNQVRILVEPSNLSTAPPVRRFHRPQAFSLPRILLAQSFFFRRTRKILSRKRRNQLVMRPFFGGLVHVGKSLMEKTGFFLMAEKG
jgi:hypothetical protein